MHDDPRVGRSAANGTREAHERCDAPDGLSFEELYRSYSHRVRIVALRYLRDPHLAEDVVQETFFRAYRSLDDLDPGRSPWPWLSVVCRNLCYDVLRHLAGHRADSIEESPLPPPGDDLEPALLARRRRLGIAEALTNLTPHQRRVLLLREVDGLRYQEIAESEGMSLEAMKSTLLRARRAFRRHYTAVAERRGLAV